MQNIVEILKSFDPISLAELQSHALMSRFDTKFKFHIDRLPEFLEQVSKDYYILDINNIRLHKYETLYFDTEEFQLFVQHHNVARNRYKIRFRRYADSNLIFFEIKQKNNKNFTVKQRIQHKSVEDSLLNETGDFLKENTKLKPGDFKPKLWVYYYRMTLVNKKSEERLTIDIDPSFSMNGTSAAFEPLVIAEVKQAKFIRSPFLALMRKNHIHVESISKYCLGVYLTNKNIKKNNFKHSITSINKLCHEKN